MRNIVTILIFGLVVYTVYPLFVGSEEMEVFCDTLEVGGSKENVLALALKSGYSNREVKKYGQLLIIDTKAMGRYICEVTILDDSVTGKKYIFND